MSWSGVEGVNGEIRTAPPPTHRYFWNNGYVFQNHNFVAGSTTITIRANGQLLAGVGPRIVVKVGSAVVGSAFVNETAYANKTFTFNASAGVQEIRVTYDNDGASGGVDRNLSMDWLEVTGPDAPPSCADASYEAESMPWSGVEGVDGQVRTAPAPTHRYFWNNGYITKSHGFLAQPMRIRVRAKGEVVGGVGPRIRLSVAGTEIGSAYVNGTNYTDHLFDFTASAGTQDIRVTYDNDSWVSPGGPGNDRNLLVDKVEVLCGSGSSITTDKEAYSAAETTHATYAGAPGNATDWVAIAPAGSPDTTYISYQYTSGAAGGVKDYPLTGYANGLYVMRLFVNGGFTRLAESAPFSVGPSAPLDGQFCTNGASGTAVVPHWSSALVGTYSGTTLLGASVTNRLAVDAQISVDIRATGLGGHVIVRRVFDGVVAADSRLPITVAIRDIPLQAPEEATQAELVVNVAGPVEYAGLVVASRPLYLRATSATFANFVLSGESHPVSAILSNPSTFQQAVAQVQGAVDGVAAPAYGRYFDSQSLEWRNLNTLPQPGGAFHLERRGVRLTPADSHTLGGLFAPDMPNVDSNYAPVRICAQWPAEFIDEGRAEVGLPYTASYAEAVISEATRLPLWSGTLDSAGCTPGLTLKNYTGYAFLLRTKLHRDGPGAGTNITVLDKSGTPATTVGGFSTLLVLRPQPSPDIYINLKVYGGTDETRVSAFVSAALKRQGAHMPAGEYFLRANSRCPPRPTGDPYSACISGEILYIGANYDSPPTHNSQFRFVIAHELGHLVQGKGSGRMKADYNGSPSRTDSSACGCAFVGEAAVEGSHCLQSKNSLGIATNEGFAHYFASRVWNYDTPSSCTFVYYKNFKEGSTLLRPPLARSCSAPVKWLLNNCAEGNRGVEWDWMNFQRAIAVSGAPTSMTDLLDIYKRACGGSSCEGVERNFQRLALAADLKFAYDSRAFEFREKGDAYGVDY